MFSNLGEGHRRTIITVAVALFFFMAIPGVATDSFLGENDGDFSVSPYEAYELWLEEQTRMRSASYGEEETSQSSFGNEIKLPYPTIGTDGRPQGTNPKPLNPYVIWEWELSWPPYNTGGGYSTDTSSVGEYQVGSTHEYIIGDQNDDGVLEWVSYYFYRPDSENGIDDDGDGCVDELSYGDKQNAYGHLVGPLPCGNNIPDAMVYFETGVYPRLAGKNADVVLVFDLFNSDRLLKIFKIGAMQKWNSYKQRGFFFYPQAYGDFISYYSWEHMFGVNSNPEMDNDLEDQFVGNIDIRGFPARTPVNHICSAGNQLDRGVTFQRDDGWTVTSYELVEQYDNHDWNGDGDKLDRVASYYAVNPVTGSCRQGVNGGVHGAYPRNSGAILTPSYTWESHDQRDWTGDGDRSDTVLLWHDINSTWHLKGRIYTSYTYTATVPSFGFGFWGRYGGVHEPIPLKFGGSFFRYTQYYTTYFWLASDEDGDPQTVLPSYEISPGRTTDNIGGRCIAILAKEWYILDLNGDGDTWDAFTAVFCPKESGGDGSWVILEAISGRWFELGSRYCYNYDHYPSLDFVVKDSRGQVAIPLIVWEGAPYAPYEPGLDLNGNLKVEPIYVHLSLLMGIPD